jgi:hypothetical protein
MIRKNWLRLATLCGLAVLATGSFSPARAQVRTSPHVHINHLQQQMQYQMMLQKQLYQQQLYQLKMQQLLYRQQMPFQQPPQVLAPPVFVPQYVPQPIVQYVPLVPQPVQQQVWTGDEDLAGYGALTFRLQANGKAVMVDAKDSLVGAWAASGNTITLTFGGGNIVYTGTIDGQTMSGTATDNRKTWNFSLTRQ